MANTTSSAVAVPPRAVEHSAAALDPAIAELLDHLARELAEEYVRLMESAAASPGADTAKGATAS